MAASRVASGIFVSRVLGLVRERAIGHFFGAGPLADAWKAALRIPNVIQNLLGEGSLSASFVPVYVRLLQEGRERDAGKVAGAVLGLLVAAAGALALLGSAAAPWVVRVLLPGFADDPYRAEVTASLLRLVFPMTAVLVVSAWLLGILNSHRKFFVSYVAPALWNLSMIGALVAGSAWRGAEGVDLVLALGWGALAGGVLQALFQLPFAVRHLRHVVPSTRLRMPEVREVLTNFVPAMTARGVVNLSALLDTLLASLLATGAVALLTYAQTLYLLPLSLFGLSVAAAELPELSRDRAAGLAAVGRRAEAAVARVLFWLVPAAVGYVLFREQAMALYVTGAFDAGDAAAAGVVLAVYALGLPASGASRVASSAFFALGDTRAPFRAACFRVVASAGAGAALMFPLDRLQAGGHGLGAAGLAGGAALGSWLELALLKRALGRRISGLSFRSARLVRLLAACAPAFGAGFAAGRLLSSFPPLVEGIGTLGAFGAVYLLVAGALGAAPPKDGPSAPNGPSVPNDPSAANAPSAPSGPSAPQRAA